MAKFTFEEVKDQVECWDWKLLSTEYINRHTNLELQCPEGHIIIMTLDNFYTQRRQRKQCRLCYREELRKKSIKNLTEQFIRENYIVHLIEYDEKGVATAIITCPRGHKDVEVNHVSLLNTIRDGKRPPCRECKIEDQSGENSHFYNHELTDEDRKKRAKENADKWAIDWKETIIKENDYTCQCCFITKDELKEANAQGHKKTKIEAHHIKDRVHHPHLRLDLENGITLCQTCHSKFHFGFVGKGKETNEELLEEFINHYRENGTYPERKATS